MQRLNGDLLTDQERATPMGFGYVAAADRLGLVYLANVGAIWKILSAWCDRVRFRHHDLITGKISEEEFWLEIEKWADELAGIMRGENPAYMAIAWFTEPNQLRQHLFDSYKKDFADDSDDAVKRHRWVSDPIREYCADFLSACADIQIWYPDADDQLREQYLHLRLTISGLLGMPEELVYEELTKFFNKS